MLGAIVEDFQGMADQVEALKQTMFCHRPDASATFQSFLENIQKERSSSSPP
jgi:hypothetical protein